MKFIQPTGPAADQAQSFFLYGRRLYPTQIYLQQLFELHGRYLYWRPQYDRRQVGPLTKRVELRLSPKSRMWSYTPADLLAIYLTGQPSSP